MELKDALASMYQHYVTDSKDVEGFLDDLAIYIRSHGCDEEAMAQEIADDMDDLKTMD
jgi:hypothetical protein